MACPKCRRDHKRSKTGPCARCYQEGYRKDPNKRKAHVASVMRYRARNPDKVKRWTRTYAERSGKITPPDLMELRRASKRLEAAIQAAEERR